MSGSLSIAPRRIVPQTGPIAWTAAEVSAGERMIPLGAEHAAELAAPGAPTPRLDALAADLGARLDHGRGFALMRGLPMGEDPAEPLRALAVRLGTPLPEGGDPQAKAGDVLLIRAAEASAVMLRSAAAIHNALLRGDKAALSALYEPQGEGGMPVFSAEGGVFAARRDDAALPAVDDPALPLTLDLRAGDILALNPFLVWAGPVPGAAVAVRTAPSRLDAAAFAPLRDAPGDRTA